MLLSDRDLRAAVADGRLQIDPYEPGLVQPSSIDVRLDRHVLAWRFARGPIDPASKPDMYSFELPEGATYSLGVGQMVLASTLEHITLGPSLAGRLEGKSSLGRLGLAAHVTAGFIDPGFAGHITLELVNHAPRPILLHPGMRIGQLCLIPMSSPVERPYGSVGVGSHYQGQRGPTPSRAWQGWRTWPTTTERTRP